jgi:hypothetical protein
MRYALLSYGRRGKVGGDPQLFKNPSKGGLFVIYTVR